MISSPRQPSSPVEAALWALTVLHAVMLLSLLTRTEPHPPLELVPFAMAPFLAACLALGAAALRLAARNGGSARLISVLFAVAALVSFGPQKYFDPGFDRVWPTVLLGQAAVLVILLVPLLEGRDQS